MTTADVQWFGTAGINPQGKSKWARSSFTELDTTTSAAGWSRTRMLYTLQLFYQVPTSGGIRNTMLDDMDTLKSAFSLAYFESVRVTNTTSAMLGMENNGTWYNQNLILELSIEGII